MRTVRTACKAFLGRFVTQAGGRITIDARKGLLKRPQEQKKTPGNDGLSIVISRCLCTEFIADT